jgi:glucose/arabinose dehydrogenase
MAGIKSNLASAQPISISSQPRSYSGKLGSGNRSDFYRFRLGGQSSLNLLLTPASADAGVRLLNRNGQIVQASDLQGKQSESIDRNLKLGTYYLQVYARTGTTRYQLKLSAFADQGGNRLTAAADLGTLGRLSLKDSVGGNDPSDYYRFQVNNRSQFTLALNSGATAGASARLLTNQGTVLQTTTGSNGTNFINATLAPGSYSVQVLPTQRNVSVRYSLDLAATPSTLNPLPTPTLTLQAGGLKQPDYITNAGDGSDRLFVVEQTGQIALIQNGQVLSTPFLNISDRVKTGGEDGLLSVAFPPNYASKRYFYVYYTNKAGNNVVARYRLTANGNVADPNSEQIILTLNHPNFSNHNGGQLAFGPDGYLYIGTGDGGGGGDPNNNAQNPKSLLGKILRIDVESPTNAAYTIPSTNPFVGTKDPGDRYRDEIWALGVRNPWRFSFDRQTGDLYIGDVGQDAYEEVDFQPAGDRGGENYGWNVLEGNHRYNNSTASTAGFTAPVLEYDHSQGQSITGGFVYRGSNPQWQGVYFYGDFVEGKVWALRRNGNLWENQLLLDTPYSISTFGQDQAGNIYLADYANGNLYKLNLPSA